MKAKLKSVFITLVATTVFWCLVIIGVFWFFSEDSGVSFAVEAHQRGFVGMMSARNTESQPVTFTVEELRTNVPSVDSKRVILLERQLPPAGEFWIGIKQDKTETKPWHLTRALQRLSVVRSSVAEVRERTVRSTAAAEAVAGLGSDSSAASGASGLGGPFRIG